MYDTETAVEMVEERGKKNGPGQKEQNNPKWNPKQNSSPFFYPKPKEDLKPSITKIHPKPNSLQPTAYNLIPKA